MKPGEVLRKERERKRLAVDDLAGQLGQSFETGSPNRSNRPSSRPRREEWRGLPASLQQDRMKIDWQSRFLSKRFYDIKTQQIRFRGRATCTARQAAPLPRNGFP